MRDMAPQIETAEISDADLDGVSGGVGASLPGGLAGVDVTPSPGGVAASLSSGVPGLGGLNGTLNAGVPHMEHAAGIVG